MEHDRVANGTVTVLAGDGERGFANGAAATARFDVIRGLARCVDGTLLAVSMESRRVQACDSDGVVTHLAGSGERGHADGAIGERFVCRSLGLRTRRKRSARPVRL